jgi:predicted cobalt transporter CbtA
VRIKIFSVTLASLLILQAGCADQTTAAKPLTNASAGPSNAQAATADQKTSSAPSQGFPRAAASNDSNSGGSFFSVGTLSSIGAAAIAVAAALAAVL